MICREYPELVFLSNLYIGIHLCSYMTNIHAQLVVKNHTDFWSKSTACLCGLVHFDGNFHGLSVYKQLNIAHKMCIREF